MSHFKIMTQLFCCPLSWNIKNEVFDCVLELWISRNGSPYVPKKLSPRASRPLELAALEPDSSSSPISANNRTPKDKRPVVPDRRSPGSPVSEKKRPSRITELESLVSKLQEELKKAKHQITLSVTSKKLANQEVEKPRKQLQEVSAKLQEAQTQVLEDYASLKLGESNEMKEEISSLRCEVERLRAALEASGRKVQAGNVAASSRLRIQAELNSELKAAKSKIDKLEARLVAKKTELKCILEEKDNLHLLLKKKNQKEADAEAELKQLREVIEKLKEHLMDEETELEIISDENETLKSDIHKRETDLQDALMKLGVAMEEADKSRQRAVRVTEQLDATQASNSEMKTELRELKVQSNQWQKAAEAATAMLSAGNNNNQTNSPYSEDIDDEVQKRKMGKRLRRLVLCGIRR
ncbi:unnamed protein product [Eruca vesicaria subsp. sativa]|uniref:ROP interactive partner 5 n=1 Tax=Eruca vesicaria subsp. sativa TaxID=29727 RepID=A0ABC8JDN2_ERUVS|nr:unnamed protein product [Eruca vesicaria subsp. sativa]